MNPLRIAPSIQNQQHGAVFLVMLVILIVGAATFLVSSLNRSAMQIQRDIATTNALAQAKEVLIGYAVTYGDTNANKAYGYLPCPDQGQSVIYDGEAGNSSTCNSKNVSYLGKLPWKTLGLSPPKDGSAECLWYAVSGTYKNTGPTDLMNWDNNGQFQVLAPDGVSLLAGSATDNQAVAVIFAPNFPFGSQTHTTAPATPSCGGNYTASNYLDNDTVHGINNATVSPTANAVTQFISGPIKDASGGTITNDRLIIISRDDIFNAIKKRGDFPNSVSNLLSTTASCLHTSLPSPVSLTFNNSAPTFTTQSSGGTTVGYLEIGRVPQTCLPSPSDNWQDNLLYAKCTTGSCLSVNSVTCRGVVIFSGERTAAQARTTNLQKNDWSNYLEGAVYTAFTTGANSFTGAVAYTASSPSTDAVACIP